MGAAHASQSHRPGCPWGLSARSQYGTHRNDTGTAWSCKPPHYLWLWICGRARNQLAPMPHTSGVERSRYPRHVPGGSRPARLGDAAKPFSRLHDSDSARHGAHAHAAPLPSASRHGHAPTGPALSSPWLHVSARQVAASTPSCSDAAWQAAP
eukprot:5212678-Prymnesium_polylepis.3